MEYKALNTVPCTQIELRKHSCGCNNNVNRIYPGLLVVFHCPLRLSLPLRRVTISKLPPIPSSIAVLLSLLIPGSGFLRPFWDYFPSSSTVKIWKMIPLEQGRICIHIAKQPVPIQLPTAAWDEPQHSGEGLLGCLQDYRLQPGLWQERAKAESSLSQ